MCFLDCLQEFGMRRWYPRKLLDLKQRTPRNQDVTFFREKNWVNQHPSSWPGEDGNWPALRDVIRGLAAASLRNSSVPRGTGQLTLCHHRLSSSGMRWPSLLALVNWVWNVPLVSELPASAGISSCKEVRMRTGTKPYRFSVVSR